MDNFEMNADHVEINADQIKEDLEKGIRATIRHAKPPSANADLLAGSPRARNTSIQWVGAAAYERPVIEAEREALSRVYRNPGEARASRAAGKPASFRLHPVLVRFGAVGVLPGYYPTGIAAALALLLTYC